MKKMIMSLLLLTSLLTASIQIVGMTGSGQYVENFNGNTGPTEDIVTLRGSGPELFDSHMYIQLERNVPISSASMKISTVGSKDGPWISEPGIDVGLDNKDEWTFAGTGYGDFGRNTLYSDDTTIKTETYNQGGSRDMGSFLVPEDAKIHDADITVRGRFQPSYDGYMTQKAQGGQISYTPEYMKLGDLDGDGINDTVISTGRPGNLYFYKNDGKGSFDSTRITAVSSVYDYEIFDVDDDGDNDLVYCKSGIRWLENDGNGSLTSPKTISTSFQPYLLDQADMDGDGENEIICAKQSFSWSTSEGAILMLKRSSGSSFDLWPLFDTGSGSGSSNIKFLKSGDWNDDDYIDVYAAFSDNKVYTFENPAYSWYYNDTSNISSKSKWDDEKVLTESNSISGFDVGDADKDGKADVIVAPSTYYSSNIYYYNNKGTSSWRKYSILTGWNYYSRSCSFTDLDNDGYLDIFYSFGSSSWNNKVGWADSKKNPNKNGWTLTNLLDGQSATGTNAFGGDVDSDGYDDALLFFTANKQVICWYNEDPYDGSAIEPSYVEDGGLVGLADLVACDVDDDTDIDYVVTASTSGSVGWFENDGSPFSGNWEFHRINGVMVAGAREVDVGDINNDGFVDLAVTAYDSGEIMWFENPGTPTSTWSYHSVGKMSYPVGCALGDLDEDGNMDIVVSPGYYYNSGLRVYESSNPEGSWSYYNIASSLSYCGAINITDMNMDGYLDVLVTVNGWSGSAQIYRNPMPSDPSSSSWRAISAISGLSYPYECLPIDINNDGNLDLVATSNYGGVTWGRCPSNRNSTGGWQSYDMTSQNSIRYPWGLAVTDVDDDGFADVFVTSHYRYSSSWTYGRGVFWLEETDDPYSHWQKRNLDTSMEETYGVQVNDLDDDGFTEVYALSNKENTFEETEPTLYYPSDIELDLGKDSVIDYERSGSLRGLTHISFGEQLQYVLDHRTPSSPVFQDSKGNRMVRVPIQLYSSNRGRLTGYGIDVRYNVTFTVDNGGELKKEISRLIPDYSDGSGNHFRLYVMFHGKTEGNAKISDLKVEYNAPPKLIKPLPEVLNVDEDSVGTHLMDLSEYFSDDYDPSNMLQYSLMTTGPYADKVDVRVENGRNVTVDSTITENYDGISAFRIKVIDNGGPGGVPSRSLSTSSIRINVRPVYDPPVVGTGSLPSKLSIEEGSERQLLDLSDMDLFYDPDDPSGSSIRYYPVIDPDNNYPHDLSHIHIWTASKKLYVRSDGDWFGDNIPVRIYGYDREDPNTLADPFRTTYLDVLNINDPPSWSAIPDASVDEDTDTQELLDLSPFVGDIDTSPMQMSYSILTHTNSSMCDVYLEGSEGSKVSFRPIRENWHGSTTVEVEVSDGEFTDITTFDIDIDPVNDLPWVNIRGLMENHPIDTETFSVAGEAGDVEGVLAVEILFQDRWYEADGRYNWGRTIKSPEIDKITENVAVMVKVIDSDGAQSFDYVNLTFYPPPEIPDLDYDDDGYSNDIDRFPYDPSEWKDTDNDNVGDNADDFPENAEWTTDSDGDGVADLADEHPFDPDPSSEEDTNIKKASAEEADMTIPYFLWVIAVISLLVLIPSVFLYIRKRSAAKDPRRSMAFYRSMEKRRRLIRKWTGRDALEKTLEKVQLKNMGARNKQRPTSRPMMPPQTMRGGRMPPPPTNVGGRRPLPPPGHGGRLPPPPPSRR